MKKLLVLFLIAIAIIPINVDAEVNTIQAIHTYRMGDNDSRNDARHICFIEAKRKVIEKAGTYVESISKVRNFQLTKDEVTAFSSALLSVETISEKWIDMSVTLTVRAVVDTSYIEKQLIRIQTDTSLQDKIKVHRSKIEGLEKTVSMLQKQLANVDTIKAAPLRKDRNILFKQISELEAKKIEIVERIQRRSRDAKKYITKGMTEHDVRSLLGKPDGVDFVRGCWRWYYGKTRVRFNDAGIVTSVY